MKRNAELVFDPGNQFGALSDCPPYFGCPSWWRRFLFRVLSQRALVVYAYLCSLMDANSVCYPTTEQIREEVGFESPTTIFSALSELEKLGFILRRRRKLPGRTYKFQRNIYQRPAPEFTLYTLINERRIDGKLYPMNVATNKPLVTEISSRSDRAVETGLRNILGEEKFASYYQASGADKTEVLKELLQVRFDERRAEMALKAQATAENSRSEVGVSIDGKKYRKREVSGDETASEKSAFSFGETAWANNQQTSDLDDEIPF